MKEVYLSAKVKVIHCLQFFKILPKVWYKCEIELAKIEGRKLAAFFKAYEGENESP